MKIGLRNVKSMCISINQMLFEIHVHVVKHARNSMHTVSVNKTCSPIAIMSSFMHLKIIKLLIFSQI